MTDESYSGGTGTETVRAVRIAIDRGGTFTDCYATWEAQVKSGGNVSWEPQELVTKLLSQDPEHYDDAPTEGIRRLMSKIFQREIPRREGIEIDLIETIRMGTTVATNALLERKGSRMALVTTQGFADMLEIGTQARPDIFDLSCRRPELLYEKVVEVEERVIPATKGEGLVDTISGEKIRIIRSPDLKKIKHLLMQLQRDGIEAVAVCFLHSYLFPDHEKQVGQLAREVGFSQVTLSSELTPMVKAVPRGQSACVDAYLTPHIRDYLDSFAKGFKGNIEGKLLFMQSDGGLSDATRFSGLRAILSGPAGGAVGCARTAYDAEQLSVIGFDMGGTSTDVTRFDGEYRHVFETVTAGVAIQTPQLEIVTVAAGGGSRLLYQDGLFKVGPQSVGALPGPVCYRKGGQLAITDANLALGRIQPDLFPAIFGPGENQPLDVEAATESFSKLADAIHGMSADQVAHGFIKVANEAMSRPIRSLTESKGWDTKDHVLCSFGGAGGQHACALADSLGISTVVIHHHASILSAYGLSLAEEVYETQEPAAASFPQDSHILVQRISHLQAKAQGALGGNGVQLATFLNIRYQGTDCSLMVAVDDDLRGCQADFEKAHKHEFGFTLPDRSVVVDDIRVRATKVTSKNPIQSIFSEAATLPRASPKQSPLMRSIYFEGGRRTVPVYRLSQLGVGEEVRGPALIVEPNSSIVIEEGWAALSTSKQLLVTRTAPASTNLGGLEVDPVRLAIFANRFMGIAEQMGRTLQLTAVSTNIKERLDFSCALFGPDGGLVANAPHIPVHLGSLSFAVKYQMQYYSQGEGLDPGDVIVTNHPAAGGSHLPDITVITPVFHEDTIVFFVASRGHHADIGGILPGSMPPHSTHLTQEGAAILSYKLVRKGIFQTEGITALLTDATHASGTRCLKDNISDLHAQVAANNKGILLVQALIAQCGLASVHAYMVYIRNNAESAVRRLLASKVPEGQENLQLYGEDRMDDGSPIRLHISISRDGSAIFDFAGTGSQVRANFNAPLAVSHSAIMYCLRCLVDCDIPLNSGCLAPLRIIVPEGCLLNPSPDAAVVGGNVTTSQRVCDVVFRAFGACGASQGCCNNLTFGNGSFGYYETIAGGSGAGPHWVGCSGTHTHMTNTRITDPEILERRYPVLLHQFSLRKGSGGSGKFRGGDGVVREMEFLVPLQVSILSERRTLAPYGIFGGSNGHRGINLLRLADPASTSPTLFPPNWDGGVSSELPSLISIGGRATLEAKPHDRIILLTPGGGGYGTC
ncbi:hypothetical protein DSO57_1015859 [Entomophthora muscae]|uniref:Uncharacterized protein n=1 Tax=Entomophthora muscae TaxID=34485 RepID=A0ACC2UQV3_9FUNG|nr:hypothetical protein DSO57_1015859 [Entomophthora muscae]